MRDQSNGKLDSTALYSSRPWLLILLLSLTCYCSWTILTSRTFLLTTSLALMTAQCFLTILMMT